MEAGMSGNDTYRNILEGLTRREFLTLSSLAAAGTLLGCAANPVTGKSQLMLVSEEQEIQIDRQNSPQQFSTDYGMLQDQSLNDYIGRVGQRLIPYTHRRQMPYRLVGVNAVYVNAYAFPGGSIAATRGILLALENEAELAALLGHELGHVNARHTAEQMSKGTVAQMAVGGLAAYAGSYGGFVGQAASALGQMGAGALLASYSRDNEREADALGMEYMVNAGYGPAGFVGLMEMLKDMSQHKPGITELFFSTHPMSDERFSTAVRDADLKYANYKNQPLERDRYMDETAKLRGIRGAVEAMQRGSGDLAQERYAAAESQFQHALRSAPEDYAALVMMAKAMMLQDKTREGLEFAEKAKRAYPGEAQAVHLSGMGKIRLKQFDGAYQEFAACNKLLPGNPNTVFLMGYSLEGMQDNKRAAQAYASYLKAIKQGPQAEHAYRRLVEWGYVKQ
jgi:predicted Zn-dependent protease